MRVTHMSKVAGISLAVNTLLTASAFAFTPVEEWSWTSSTVAPDALNVMNTPSVIDLDGDMVPEIVFSSTQSRGGGLVEVGFLRAISGVDGTELFAVTATTPIDLRVSTTCSVATGDIDNDGRPEIIACDVSGSGLIAFEHDGSFKWRASGLGRNGWGAPSIADLDGDGQPEIIIGNQALDNAGNLLWTGAGTVGSQSSTGPLSLVSDIDLDGSPEIVAGPTVYAADGTVEVRNFTLGDGYTGVGNFDADDEAEIVLVTGGGVYLLEHDLSVIWGPAVIPGGGVGGPPTIADYDSDGEAEIGVAGASRYAVFETDGSLKWTAITQDSSSNRTGSSVFDFDSDGAAEVVYSDERSIFIYRGLDGEILFQTALSSCTWHEYPLVADVDGDNSAELVAVANNNCGFGPQRGIYVYGDADDSWALTRRIWNQHTYHITNINADGSIPVEESPNWLTPGLNNFRLNEFGEQESPPCDIDANRVIDVNDIRAIIAARNTAAVPGDGRDADGDGVITVNDARRCVLQCTNSRCASNP